MSDDGLIRHGEGLHAQAHTEPMRSQCVPCLESQNQALQERAEKAEAALRRIAELDEAWVVTDNVRGTHLVKLALRALSPTQETDPEPGDWAEGIGAGGQTLDR